MFLNYFKIALRNLSKNKLYSFINISGLAFGITCFLLISIYLNNELSYDNFHKEPEKIFRVLRISEDETGNYNIGSTSGPFAQALVNDYPSYIESATRVFGNSGLVEYKEKVFRENKIFFADSNFFEFFNFPLVSGDKNSVLNDGNSIVISVETAKKYFGDLNPIGEVILIDKFFEFKVTGVFDNRNLNSHLNFDFVGSILQFEKFSWFPRWWNNMLSTYIKVSNPAVEKNLKEDFPNFMEKYFGDHFAQTGKKTGLTIESLQDIYFNNETQNDSVEHGNLTSLYIFSFISFFILIIACINFMNLSIAVSARRSKEVGLRKVIGAEKRNIIFQFIGEAIVYSGIAFVISLFLLEVILPYFNSFIGKELNINYSIAGLTFAALFFVLTVGILSGGYPAFILSSVQPAKILKGDGASIKSGKSILRRVLVVTQFAISIILIIGTILITKQMNYLSNAKLGFNKEQVVLLNVDNENFRNNLKSFKDELNRNTNVVNVTAMSGEPGGFHDTRAYKIADMGGEYVRMRSLFCDENYLKTFGIEVIEGRDFSRDFATDKNDAIILNETAVRTLGWTPKSALGKLILINLMDSTYRHVVGVVKDYNFTSLKTKIEPLAIALLPDYRKAAVKIKGEDVDAALKSIEKVYARVSPGYSFEYEFLDESFNKLYKSEKDAQILITNFSITAIIIACLGLFGLVMYAAELKKKEIGIRKVLGASVAGIVTLITKEFLVLVVIANLIAWPISYYFMKEWLSDFAYKINIGIESFLISALIAFLIAIVTIGFQAIKAALANPVKSIKYE
ncbi:MAG: hypothetical protein A2068_00955 [Ignavibacteria bacterium GWB2_35_6b]|nr:MAG: hypothetical protein A2068_00955 [Ignavibacteria bacterium GWB2_35_6b]